MADDLGSVDSLWRYPVKSMLGERLEDSPVTPYGLLGDRLFALRDAEDGKVATAKNPRKWPTLFAFAAALAEGADEEAAGVRITLPDGSVIGSDDPTAGRILSHALGREVSLERAERGVTQGVSEAYQADIEEVERRDTVVDFTLPEGTFFDGAYILLITRATLAKLSALYPEGRFDERRFRPNLVLDVAGEGFVENTWLGRTLAIGDEVRLSVIAPCGRCVMTTLPQQDLPRDLGILKTAARHNGAQVGVYAAVERGGTVRRGDRVQLE